MLSSFEVAGISSQGGFCSIRASSEFGAWLFPFALTHGWVVMSFSGVPGFSLLKKNPNFELHFQIGIAY